MADSQLILELLFLQRRGGCSLTVLLFLTKDGKSIVHKSKVDTWFNGVVEKSTFMKANKDVC